MNISNYISRKLPNTQQILQVPLNNNPVPAISSPRNPTSNNYSIAPQHKNEDSNAYCNILPPAPRSQLTNYPQRNTMCPKINPKPYTKNSCYLVNNKEQGVVGLVCNNAGGSDNSNFIRGYQFSNDYYWINSNEYEKSKIQEYTVEQPVQKKMELENPTIIYEPSNFYPTKTYTNKQHPWYRTYPKFKNYTANGLPIYTYPANVLNPVQKAGGSMTVEGFSNQLSGLQSNNLIYFFAIIIILIVCIIYFL